MGRKKKRKQDASYSLRNKNKLVPGGSSYFEVLLELIASAQDTIHLQTYIYIDDQTGRLVADGLIAAAGRGVAVYLLADGYASRKMSPAFIAMLKDGGVHFRFFEPLFRGNHFYFGRRLHH